MWLEKKKLICEMVEFHLFGHSPQFSTVAIEVNIFFQPVYREVSEDKYIEQKVQGIYQRTWKPVIRERMESVS